MHLFSVGVFCFSVLLVVRALPALENRGLAQVFTHCTVPNTVAFTFDDGPYHYIRNVSDTLIAAGAKGTFFANGLNWDCIYAPEFAQGLRYAYSHGHQIASHTWAHRNLSSLTSDEVETEFTLLDQALLRILGIKAAFMRPPYGAYNQIVQQVAANHGQKIVIWDFDSGDSVGHTPQQSIQAYQTLANQHPTNVLTLNHETYNTTVFEVLPKALAAFKGKGYRFVTVAECLGEQPYQSVGAPAKGSWTC